MQNEITYPFPNFNGVTVEVWEWMRNFIPHFNMHVNTYAYRELICKGDRRRVHNPNVLNCISESYLQKSMLLTSPLRSTSDFLLYNNLFIYQVLCSEFSEHHQTMCRRTRLIHYTSQLSDMVHRYCAVCWDTCIWHGFELQNLMIKNSLLHALKNVMLNDKRAF